MHHRARIEYGLPNVEINILECIHCRRQRRRRMGDELWRACGSGRCQQNRQHVLVGSGGRGPPLVLSVSSADQGIAPL